MSVTAYEHPLAKYIRPSAKTTANCPGCGNGILAQSILRAIEELGLTLDDFVFVSGIGCAAWIPSPSFFADVLHTTHGRPIAFGIGIKAALPHKRVMVISGDGDLTAIGGNHLIHAARRNVDLTVICINNFNYGMTGGQAGPTSQEGARTATTPKGNVEASFNLPALVAAAGGTYVARWTVLDLGRLRRSIIEALHHPGFAFVEVISPCPIYYGRFNRKGDSLGELRYYKENTVVKNFAPLQECDLGVLGGKIVVGKFVEEKKPTFLDRLSGVEVRG